MKYIVYQTTNLVNNKIYIGVHKTKDPEIFDGYLGCGVSLNEPSMYMNPRTPFQYAVKKYGVKNFKRVVLKVFDLEDDAYRLESELVNIDFIKRNDTYNIALGGNKGSYYFPINQFDREGNFIKQWDNMAIAAETLGVSRTSINNAKLYKGSCLGYFWSTKNKINPQEFHYCVGTMTYKYNLDGELVASYSSITEAAKANNTHEKTIYRSIQMSMKVNNYYYSYILTDNFIPKQQPKLKNKIIYIYDLEGNYITEKKSGRQLKEYYNITSYGCLKQALMTGNPYKGTQLSLEKVDRMPLAKEPKNKAKKIGCYDLNGNLLEEFDSITAAVKKYGSGVSRVLNNRQKKTKDLIFKYL